MNYCKLIIIYLADIFLLQHTYQNQTIDKLIVSSNTRLKENNNLIIEKVF